MDDTDLLLPWYLNGSLGIQDRQSVSAWLCCDAVAYDTRHEVQQIAAMVRTQKVQSPSAGIDVLLFAKIKEQNRKRRLHQWAWSIFAAALFFVLLWLIIQPGVWLRWSVRGSEAAEFRVYRAPVGSNSFKLVAEIPALTGRYRYQYRDLGVLPGKSCHYAVEIVDWAGNTSYSPVVATNPWESLTVYVTIMLTSFVLAFGMITIIKPELRISRIMQPG
jgi:hypothetical protein